MTLTECYELIFISEDKGGLSTALTKSEPNEMSHTRQKKSEKLVYLNHTLIVYYVPF